MEREEIIEKVKVVIVEQLNVEAPGEYKASSAETLLEQL